MKFNEESSQAGGGFDTIPAGTLAMCALSVRAMKESQGKAAGAMMADVELVITSGPFAKRKIWEFLMDPDAKQLSDQAREQAMGKLCRILESTGVCVPGQVATYTNPQLATFKGALDAIQAAVARGAGIGVKIMVEPATGGYAEKNKVGAFLSPNPKSGSRRDWDKLLAGANAAPAPAVAAPAGFGAPTPAATPSALQTPGWVGGGGWGAPNTPGAGASALKDDEIPF